MVNLGVSSVADDESDDGVDKAEADAPDGGVGGVFSFLTAACLSACAPPALDVATGTGFAASLPGLVGEGGAVVGNTRAGGGSIVCNKKRACVRAFHLFVSFANDSASQVGFSSHATRFQW